MIDHISISQSAAQESQAFDNKKVLQMVRHERMGGYVPSWENAPAEPHDQIEQTLSEAQNFTSGNVPSFTAALAYQSAQETGTPVREEAGFGFGDLVDIINPMHHIPVVGHAYRAMTGDEINPMGRIVGGALFGGPLGAAASLVNIVIEEETGKSIASNAYAMVMDGKTPDFKNVPPQDTLNKAVRIAENHESISGDALPASLLAFTPASYNAASSVKPTYAHASQARYNS